MDESHFIKNKSVWSEPGQIWRFFCPQCRSARAVRTPRSLGWSHVGQVFLTSLTLTALSWPWLGMKAMATFPAIWVIFEISYRLLRRAALKCPHCGFDAFLYLRDVKEARKEMDGFWRQRFAEKNIPYPFDIPGDIQAEIEDHANAINHKGRELTDSPQSDS